MVKNNILSNYPAKNEKSFATSQVRHVYAIYKLPRVWFLIWLLWELKKKTNGLSQGRSTSSRPLNLFSSG